MIDHGTSIAIQGGKVEIGLSAMLKLLFVREHLFSWFGFTTAWTSLLLSNLKSLTPIVQLCTSFLGAAVAAVTLGWTIWKWRRDIHKLAVWDKKNKS